MCTISSHIYGHVQILQTLQNTAPDNKHASHTAVKLHCLAYNQTSRIN